jgi:hypothetical protein
MTLMRILGIIIPVSYFLIIIKMSLKYYYFFTISLAGFFVLTVMSALAFVNHEYLKIKQGKHINSGIMLIVTAVVGISLI